VSIELSSPVLKTSVPRVGARLRTRQRALVPNQLRDSPVSGQERSGDDGPLLAGSARDNPHQTSARPRPLRPVPAKLGQEVGQDNPLIGRGFIVQTKCGHRSERSADRSGVEENDLPFGLSKPAAPSRAFDAEPRTRRTASTE
jgi:hypothetical protein